VGWLLVIAGILLLVFFFAAMSRRAKQRAAVRGLRRHFPEIARDRLVSNFPDLDPVLDAVTLRILFDWILAQAYCRTNSRGFGDLMRWEIENGEAAMADILESVTIDAVNRLPRSALAVIDGSTGGRAYAAILIEHSITEAGARIAPQLERDYV